MVPTKTFMDIEAWKQAHVFVLAVYSATNQFPNNEIYGLTSQFRIAAVSIAANIAEGYKKKGNADKLRFYNISQGTIEECRYCILLSKDLLYINNSSFIQLNENLELCSKLLNNYCRAIPIK